jgi:hypothetical protein
LDRARRDASVESQLAEIDWPGGPPAENRERAAQIDLSGTSIALTLRWCGKWWNSSGSGGLARSGGGVDL